MTMTTAPFDVRPLSACPARVRRHLRVRVAQRLLARRLPQAGEGATPSVNIEDWQVLDTAPCWLALDHDDLQRWLCRVGAVFCAPALCLWIDARRTRAARAAVGADYLDRLMDAQDLPRTAGIAPLPGSSEHLLRGQDPAAAIHELLRASGAAVIVNAMGRGPLRQAVSAALAPVAEIVMPTSHAACLQQRAVAIAEMVAATAEEPVHPASEQAAKADMPADGRVAA